jgi:hypothetical protein
MVSKERHKRNYVSTCSDFNETSSDQRHCMLNFWYRIWPKSQTECGKYGHAFTYDSSEQYVRLPMRSISHKVELSNGTAWYAVTNFTHVNQEKWKVGVEVSLDSENNVNSHWADFHETRTCSTRKFCKRLNLWHYVTDGQTWSPRICSFSLSEIVVNSKIILIHL